MATRPPKTTNRSTVYTDPSGKRTTIRWDWTNYYTLKGDGRPDLRAQNPHRRWKTRLTGTGFTRGVDPIWGPAPWLPVRNAEETLNDVSLSGDFTGADNLAYARFRKQLYEGSANLGVTFGETRQTLSMVRGKTVGLANALGKVIRQLEADRNLIALIKKRGLLARDVLGTWSADGQFVGRSVKRRIIGRRLNAVRPGVYPFKGAGRFVKQSSNELLEYKFGWTPLFQDVNSLLRTVLPKAVPDAFISASGSRVQTWNRTYNGLLRRVGTAKLTTRYTARVRISNPNLWLASRAGLINLPAIAWDLVPWSWVVGMFGNFNQIINSWTDFVGLEMSSHCITRRRRGFFSDVERGSPVQTAKPSTVSTTFSTWTFDIKNQTVGAPLRPSFEKRVPELNADLIVTAAALVVQRMGKITKLLS